MRRPGPDEWKRLIAEYEESGVVQKEFCDKHDVSLSTFQYWLYKRTKMASKFDVNSKPTFLPVKVVASHAPKARAGDVDVLEARLMSGVVVRFAVGTDTRYVAELLAALG
jgi:transposase-like protein